MGGEGNEKRGEYNDNPDLRPSYSRGEDHFPHLWRVLTLRTWTSRGEVARKL